MWLLVFIRWWGRLLTCYHLLYHGDVMLSMDFDPHYSGGIWFCERSYSKLFPRRFAVIPVFCCVSWSLVSTLQEFRFRNFAMIQMVTRAVRLIAWWRLTVSNRNVATYISSEYIMRQTIKRVYYYLPPQSTITSFTIINTPSGTRDVTQGVEFF